MTTRAGRRVQLLVLWGALLGVYAVLLLELLFLDFALGIDPAWFGVVVLAALLAALLLPAAVLLRLTLRVVRRAAPD